MPGNNTTYNVGINVKSNVSDAKRGINDLKQSLNSLSSINTDNLNVSQKFKDGVDAAKKLQTALQGAVNVNTGKLDLSKFNKQIKSSGETLTQMSAKLIAMGPQGQQTFQQLANSIAQAEVPLRRTSGLLNSMFKTLGTTIKYSLSYGAINMFTQSVREAVRYAENLNGSLNNIRIVTGQSAEQMNQFAKRANQAAKELRASTLEYTNASLIYYQQGLSDAEVKERTDATIKMANVTKDGATEVSSYMTAIWNNFDTTGKKLEYFGDVVTALGAKTASSSSEIAGGLEKFASVADTIGLSYEYAAASLATIVAKTRQSEDVVGTALKTIFSRMEGLKLGESLEDGTDLNKYSAALASVGVNIKEANGELKTMDEILDETGERWRTLTNDQQVALAQSVAGIRQYSQFIALMDNWNDIKVNVDVALDASGTLDEQQKIYEESWEAANKRVQASMETLYSQIINDEDFIGFFNGLSGAIDDVTQGIEAIGGITPIITVLAGALMSAFGPQLAASINRTKDNLLLTFGVTQKKVLDVKTEMASMLETMGGAHGPYADLYNKLNLDKVTTAISNRRDLEKDIQSYLIDQAKIENEMLTTAEQRVQKAQQEAELTRQKIKDLGSTEGNISNNTKIKDFQEVADLQNSLGLLRSESNIVMGANATIEVMRSRIPEVINQLNILKENASDLYGAMGQAFNNKDIDNFTTKIDGVISAFNKLNNSSISEQEKAKQLQDALNNMGEEAIKAANKVGLISEKTNTINYSKIGAFTREFLQIGNAVGSVEQGITRLTQKYNISREDAQKYVDALAQGKIEEANQLIAQAQAEMIQTERYKQMYMAPVKNDIGTLVAGTAQMATNIGSMGYAWDAFITQLKSSNKNFASMAMSLGMLVTSGTSFWNILSKTFGLTKAINLQKEMEIALEKTTTGEMSYQDFLESQGISKEVAKNQLKLTQAQLEQKITKENVKQVALNQALNIKLIAVVAAIAVVVASITLLVHLTKQWTEQNQRVLEKLQEQKKAIFENQNLLQDELDKTKNKLKEVNEQFDKFDEVPDKLSKMTKGSQEYNDTIKESNKELIDLLDSLNMLNSNNYTIASNGLYQLTDDAKSQIQNKLDNQLRQQELEFSQNKALSNRLDSEIKKQEVLALNEKERSQDRKMGTAALGTASGIGAGIVTASAYVAAGAALGSVVPILGTAIGTAAGLVIGGLIGGAIGDMSANAYASDQEMNQLIDTMANSNLSFSQLKEEVRKGKFPELAKTVDKLEGSNKELIKSIDDAAEALNQSKADSWERTLSDARNVVRTRNSGLSEEEVEQEAIQLAAYVQQEQQKYEKNSDAYKEIEKLAKNTDNIRDLFKDREQYFGEKTDIGYLYFDKEGGRHEYTLEQIIQEIINDKIVEAFQATKLTYKNNQYQNEINNVLQYIGNINASNTKEFLKAMEELELVDSNIATSLKNLIPEYQVLVRPEIQEYLDDEGFLKNLLSLEDKYNINFSLITDLETKKIIELFEALKSGDIEAVLKIKTEIETEYYNNLSLPIIEKISKGEDISTEELEILSKSSYSNQFSNINSSNTSDFKNTALGILGQQPKLNYEDAMAEYNKEYAEYEKKYQEYEKKLKNYNNFSQQTTNIEIPTESGEIITYNKIGNNNYKPVKITTTEGKIIPYESMRHLTDQEKWYESQVYAVPPDPNRIIIERGFDPNNYNILWPQKPSKPIAPTAPTLQDYIPDIVNKINQQSSFSELSSYYSTLDRNFLAPNGTVTTAYIKKLKELADPKIYPELTKTINKYEKALSSSNLQERKAAISAYEQALKISELNKRYTDFQKDYKDSIDYFKNNPIKLTTDFNELTLDERHRLGQLAEGISTFLGQNITIDQIQADPEAIQPILNGEALSEADIGQIKVRLYAQTDEAQTAFEEVVKTAGMTGDQITDIIEGIDPNLSFIDQLIDGLARFVGSTEEARNLATKILGTIPGDINTTLNIGISKTGLLAMSLLDAQKEIENWDWAKGIPDIGVIQKEHLLNLANQLGLEVDKSKSVVGIAEELANLFSKDTSKTQKIITGGTSTGDKDKDNSQSNKEPTKLKPIDTQTREEEIKTDIEKLDSQIALLEEEYNTVTTLTNKIDNLQKQYALLQKKRILLNESRDLANKKTETWKSKNLRGLIDDNAIASEIFGADKAYDIQEQIKKLQAANNPKINEALTSLLNSTDRKTAEAAMTKLIDAINAYNEDHKSDTGFKEVTIDTSLVNTAYTAVDNVDKQANEAKKAYLENERQQIDNYRKQLEIRKQDLEYLKKAIELQKKYNDVLYGEDNYSDEAISATFENIYKGLNAANISLEETQKLIDGLKFSSDLQNGIWTDEMENDFQEYTESYIEYLEAIQNYSTESFEVLNNVYDKYSEKIKSNMDYLQSLMNITESYYNIFDRLSKITDPLTGKALFADYNTLARTRQIQEDFTMAITVQQRDRVREQQTLLQQAAEGLARAQAGNNQRLIKQAQDYYDKIKEQAQEAEEEFISSISEAIDKTFENLADSISRLFTETTKDLYAVGGIEDFNKNMELRNQLEDEYLDEANKEYELNKLQRQIQQEISKNNTLLTRTKLGDLMREITEAQKSSTELSKTELTFLQKKYQLRLAEIALEEAQNNKTSMRLVRNSRGQYDYVFTADQAAIDSAQQKLEDAQIDLHNTARDLLKQALTDTNSMLSSFGEEMSSAQTLEEQQEIQARYLRQLEIYDNRIKRAEEALGPELFAQLIKQYGANETTPQQFINRVTGTINSFATEAGVLAQQATERVSNYAKILGSVTEEGIFDSEKMMNRVMANFNLTEKAIEEDSKEMTEKINDVWSHLKTVIDKINKVNWEEVTKHLKSYLDQIESFSEKSIKPSKRDIKDAYENGAMTEAEVAKAMGWSNPSNSSSSNTSNSSSNTNNDNNNNSVITGTLDGKNYTQTKNSNGTYTITAADGSGSWTLKKPYFSGETGGYTGDFDGGKWGLLHEKELVLNKEDTSNILEAVSLVRQMAGSILKDARDRANLMRYFTANQVPNFKYPSAQHDLNQNVSIEANFPNVSSAAEIEEALDNLINQSAQYGQIYQD